MDTTTLICLGVVALMIGAGVFFLLGNHGGDVWSSESQKRLKKQPLNEIVAKAEDEELTNLQRRNSR